jgi:hypothetical protein
VSSQSPAPASKRLRYAEGKTLAPFLNPGFHRQQTLQGALLVEHARVFTAPIVTAPPFIAAKEFRGSFNELLGSSIL